MEDDVPGGIAVVTALIMDRPLCMSCLYERSASTSLEVDRALDAIADVRRQTLRCHACGNVRPTVSLKRLGA